MAARLPDAEPRATRAMDTPRLLTPALTGRTACVDLETTGGLAAHHRIIEVGIVLLEGGVVVEQWSSLVNPCVRIPSPIEQFTGIDNEMVADAPAFEQIASEIRKRLDGCLFVAQNARFDYGFLRAEFRRLGERYSARVLCTVRLSRALFPSEHRHNLDALMERHGLVCAARHRALGDAQVLPDLLHAFERAVGPETLEGACVSTLRETRLPPQLPSGLADDLPDAPGVYIFRGEGGAVLYVGKSANIRSRVLGHFAGDHRDGRDRGFAASVRDISWVETGGELGALLLESKLVRQWLPAANRHPRQQRSAFVLRLHDSADGATVHVEPFDADAFDSEREAYGPFRAACDAQRALEGKARDAQLCLKTLGLEQTEGSCLAFQFGRCRGVCVGREPRALHDARVRLALASLRLKPWPFAGAIGIRERAAGGSGTVLHVLDRWCHLGTVESDDELDALLSRTAVTQSELDVDSYRIIGRCLQRVDARDLLQLTAHADSR